jgi:hypothetical protein
MRFLVCLLIGLALGALVTRTWLAAVAERHAWPRAVMQVMQHELGAATSVARAGRCKDPALDHGLRHIDSLAGDIAPATGRTTDHVFQGYVEDLRKAVATAALDRPACAARATALEAVGKACERCHRDYRQE